MPAGTLLHVCPYRVKTKNFRHFIEMKQRQPVNSWMDERLPGAVDY